jgi:RES domain-containing protein
MTVYRLHRAARSAWDATGAMLAGGRWNPIGTPVLYTAQHLPLACLEILVHLDRGQLPDDYVWSKVELPQTPEFLPVSDLYQVSTCQATGAAWIQSGRQLAVQVPSVVIPIESNVLLNPTHPIYRTLAWSVPQPFRFDPRLFLVDPQPL